MRDELISVFLGAPELPTPFGYQLLTLSDETIAQKISMILQQPSNDIESLQEIIRQLNPSTAVFVQSHARLLQALSEWKRSAIMNQRARHSGEPFINKNRYSNWCSSQSRVSNPECSHYLEKLNYGTTIPSDLTKSQSNPQETPSEKQESCGVIREPSTMVDGKSLYKSSSPHSLSFLEKGSSSGEKDKYYEHIMGLLKKITETRNNPKAAEADEKKDSPTMDCDVSTLHIKSGEWSIYDICDPQKDRDLIAQKKDLTMSESPATLCVKLNSKEDFIEGNEKTKSIISEINDDRPDDKHEALMLNIDERTPSHCVPLYDEPDFSPLNFNSFPSPPNVSPNLSFQNSEKSAFSSYNNALDLLDAVATSLEQSINKQPKKTLWETTRSEFNQDCATVKEQAEKSSTIDLQTQTIMDPELWTKSVEKPSDKTATIIPSSLDCCEITTNKLCDASKLADKHLNDSDYQDRLDADGDTSTKASSRRYSIRTSEGSLCRFSMSPQEISYDVESPQYGESFQGLYFVLQRVVDVLLGVEEDKESAKGFTALQKLYSISLCLNTIECRHLPIRKSGVMVMAERASLALTTLVWNIILLNRQTSVEYDATFASSQTPSAERPLSQFSMESELPYEVLQLPHMIHQIEILGEEAALYVEEQWNSRAAFLCRAYDEMKISDFLDIHFSSLPLDLKSNSYKKTLINLARIDLELIRCETFTKHTSIQKKIREGIFRRLCNALH